MPIMLLKFTVEKTGSEKLNNVSDRTVDGKAGI